MGFTGRKNINHINYYDKKTHCIRPQFVVFLVYEPELFLIFAELTHLVFKKKN